MVESTVTVGSSATFTYSGQINFGFLSEGLNTHSVVSGQQYLVTVIGTDAIAGKVIVAT